MKTELVKVSQVQLNQANPRTITDSDFEKLVNSILMLPKMLELRPVVVDNTFTALGGNMRSKALSFLADLKDFELVDRLRGLNGYKKKTEVEQKALEEYWCAWLDKPVVPIVKATNLTDEEKQEFIIKDNGSFGKWDFEMLEQAWDLDSLKEWGVDGALEDDGQDWGNLDFVGGDQKDPKLDKDIKIAVVVPFQYKDKEDEVRQAIENAIKDFGYCDIK